MPKPIIKCENCKKVEVQLTKGNVIYLMNVKELKEILNNYDNKTEVIYDIAEDGVLLPIKKVFLMHINKYNKKFLFLLPEVSKCNPKILDLKVQMFKSRVKNAKN